jgi:diketogulonate reductase-like aldo/keto reductase
MAYSPLGRGFDRDLHVVPIPGTKRRTFPEQNVAAVDLRLTVAEIESLRAAFPPGAAAGLRYPEFQLRKLLI